jgi:hypothetical protein
MKKFDRLVESILDKEGWLTKSFLKELGKINYKGYTFFSDHGIVHIFHDKLKDGEYAGEGYEASATLNWDGIGNNIIALEVAYEGMEEFYKKIDVTDLDLHNKKDKEAAKLYAKVVVDNLDPFVKKL